MLCVVCIAVVSPRACLINQMHLREHVFSGIGACKNDNVYVVVCVGLCDHRSLTKVTIILGIVKETLYNMIVAAIDDKKTTIRIRFNAGEKKTGRSFII